MTKISPSKSLFILLSLGTLFHFSAGEVRAEDDTQPPGVYYNCFKQAKKSFKKAEKSLVSFLEKNCTPVNNKMKCNGAPGAAAVTAFENCYNKAAAPHPTPKSGPKPSHPPKHHTSGGKGKPSGAPTKQPSQPLHPPVVKPTGQPSAPPTQPTGPMH